jgi:4-hydroxythreonine-4-phosphate dehydrogenase
LCAALATRELPCELVCLADEVLLRQRAQLLGLDLTLRRYDAQQSAGPGGAGTLRVLHQPLAVAAIPGRPDPANARYVLGLIDRALTGALGGEFDAVVTAPVHKGIINEAGIAFSGHTEYLEERCPGARAVMLLTTGELRVALATTHLPLQKVSAAITIESLCRIARVLADALEHDFGIAAARIAVCGLNPHAGEGGYLGDEELRVIGPAVERMQREGIRASGPLPADTVFVPRVLAGFDAVLAMYHDQGLPVVKHAGFDRAVNVTLGLPLIRTSPDHGTAFDLAGTGRADPGSLIAAVELASRLAGR